MIQTGSKVTQNIFDDPSKATEWIREALNQTVRRIKKPPKLSTAKFPRVADIASEFFYLDANKNFDTEFEFKLNNDCQASLRINNVTSALNDRYDCTSPFATFFLNYDELDGFVVPDADCHIVFVIKAVLQTTLPIIPEYLPYRPPTGCFTDWEFLLFEDGSLYQSYKTLSSTDKAILIDPDQGIWSDYDSTYHVQRFLGYLPIEEGVNYHDKEVVEAVLEEVIKSCRDFTFDILKQFLQQKLRADLAARRAQAVKDLG